MVTQTDELGASLLGSDLRAINVLFALSDNSDNYDNIIKKYAVEFCCFVLAARCFL